MDWTTVITSIVTFVFGGGLVGIVTIPQMRKKGDIENESLATETLRNTITELRVDNERKDVKIAQLEDKNAITVGKYEDKCEESATAKSMMCIHLGCSLRDPLLGQGDSWLETHKDDMSLSVDFLPVNVLMKRLGEKRKAQKEQGDEA